MGNGDIFNGLQFLGKEIGSETLPPHLVQQIHTSHVIGLKTTHSLGHKAGETLEKLF